MTDAGMVSKALEQEIRDEIRLPFYVQNVPNDGQRFVAWYLRNIHLKDMNEAKDCQSACFH